MNTKWIFLLLMPSIAHAHPGDHHGSLWATISHLLSEPDHLALLFFAVAGGIWLALRKYKKSS